MMTMGGGKVLSGKASERMWYLTWVLYKEQGFATWEKKCEKRIAEDEKLVRKDFERNDFLIKDMKAFCSSFVNCSSNRKSLTFALQWNSMWCWWDDNWAITKIHEHFPMENSHKVCCFSQIHESVKQKAYKEKHLCSWV